MLTKSFQSKLMFYVDYVNKIKIGAKISIFVNHFLSFLHRSLKMSVFSQNFVWAQTWRTYMWCTRDQKCIYGWYVILTLTRWPSQVWGVSFIILNLFMKKLGFQRFWKHGNLMLDETLNLFCIILICAVLWNFKDTMHHIIEHYHF
jgi:hypothetical protein